MKRSILLYPTLNEEFMSRIRFQCRDFCFFYTDNNDEYELVSDSCSSVLCIKDSNGRWTQDDYNFCFRREYSLRTFNCLFGKKGIVCSDAELGFGVQWTSHDSGQRGFIKGGEFTAADTEKIFSIEKKFIKAQLRGNVIFSTVLYLASPGKPSTDEQHLANTKGYILGELDSCTVQLDGTGSMFPVYEVTEQGQPLWNVSCDWDDPTVDSFSDCISVNLNKGHKNFAFLDRDNAVFNKQLLIEVMSGALILIIEKIRRDDVYWDQIRRGEGLVQGSVGQAIHYFMSCLDWDLSSVENESLSIRKFFDQKM